MFDFIEKKLAEIIEDPFSVAVDAVTQPVIDAADILDGLTEGEIREKAAIRLGVDVVSGMALGEVIGALMEESSGE